MILKLRIIARMEKKIDDRKRIIDEFIAPYYRDKDIMHNMWHIELVRRQVEKSLRLESMKLIEMF